MGSTLFLAYLRFIFWPSRLILLYFLWVSTSSFSFGISLDCVSLDLAYPREFVAVM